LRNQPSSPLCACLRRPKRVLYLCSCGWISYPQSTTKVSFGGAVFVAPKTQLLATVGRDLHVRQGFKENARINLRLLQVF